MEAVGSHVGEVREVRPLERPVEVVGEGLRHDREVVRLKLGVLGLQGHGRARAVSIVWRASVPPATQSSASKSTYDFELDLDVPLDDVLHATAHGLRGLAVQAGAGHPSQQLAERRRVLHGGQDAAQI